MFKPKKGIILYQNTMDAYAEVHDIDNNGEFLAGRPMFAHELIQFEAICSEEQTLMEKDCFAYRNIIGYNSNLIGDRVAWIYPASKIELIYSSNVKGLKTGDYYIPNLIFISDGHSVDVYAIKKKDILNLSPDVQVYKAPFLNTYNGGSVCMGSAKVDQYNDVTEMIHSVENAFFKSVFTHTSENNIVHGGIIDCYMNQKRSFNEKLLVKSKKLNKIW